MMNPAQRKRLMDRKWKSLIARGILPPKDKTEARKRLKEAHSGN